MFHKPTYNELLQKIESLEKEVIDVQKKAQKENLKYIDLFEALDEGYIITNKDGYIVKVNMPAVRMCGYTSANEMEGKRMIELYANPLDRYKMFLDIDQSKLLKNYEILFKRKDHSVFWTSCNIRLITDDNNQIIGTEGLVRDITRIKNVENDLLTAIENTQEKETFIRTIYNAAIDFSIIIIDITQEIPIIKSFSPGAEKIFGYKAEEIIGKPASALYKQTDEYEFSQLIHSFQKEQKNYSCEKIQVRKSGEDFPTLLNIYPLFNTKRQLHSLLSISIDITELKMTQHELEVAKKKIEETEIKYTTAFKTSPDAICITRFDGTYIDINEGYAKLTGYSSDVVLGTTSFKINIWNNPDDRVKLVNGLKEYGRIENLEAGFRCKDGNVVYGLMSAAIIQINGAPHILSITKDISIRKRLEYELISAKNKAEEISEKLKETDRKLKLKLDYILSPDMTIENLTLTDIIDIDLLQKIQDNFVKATKVASIITDAEGQPITQPSNFSGVCQMIRQTTKGRKNCNESDKLIGQKSTRTSKLVIARCSSCGFLDAGAPIIVAGKPLAFWMIGQSCIGNVDANRIRQYALEIDCNPEQMLEEYNKMETMSFEQFQNVSNFLSLLSMEISNLAYNNILLAKSLEERKIVENELILAKEKAEKSDTLKSIFLQNISHEVRTPLNAIQGFASLITFPDQDTETLNFYSKMIASNTDKLVNIITDVIEMSQIQTKQMHSRFAQIEFISFISELYWDYKEKRSITILDFYLNNKIEAKELFIYSDSLKLTRIIAHLLDNSFKFTNEGAITLSIENPDKQSIVISVSDTGIGISPEMQEIIFEPFRQIETGSSRKYGGNGLGLAIVKAYTELLEGTLTVKSELNVGTTITITLPINYQTVDNTPTPTKTKSIKTVLIAEDEHANYRYMEELLKKQNLNILHATNGQKAVEICRTNQKIDIVLMDIKMPEMDGYTAAKLIKEFRPQLIIVALSAYALDSEKEKYSNIFDNYITKPLKKKDLKVVMSESS